MTPLSRRHFLGAALATAATSSLPSAFATRRSEGRLPVLVIGAGLAGLAAAHTIRASGGRAIVIEASTRVGGRALTAGPHLQAAVQSLDCTLDVRLGASLEALTAREDRVVVHTATGELHGARALIALPPSALAMLGARLGDAMPRAKRLAVDRLAAGGRRAADIRALAMRVGPVAFAGDHTVLRDFRSGRGAVRSGVRAAGQVLRSAGLRVPAS